MPQNSPYFQLTTSAVVVAVVVATFVGVAGAMISDGHLQILPAAGVVDEAYHPISDWQSFPSVDLSLLAVDDGFPLLPMQQPELAAVSFSAVDVVTFVARRRWMRMVDDYVLHHLLRPAQEQHDVVAAAVPNAVTGPEFEGHPAAAVAFAVVFVDAVAAPFAVVVVAVAAGAASDDVVVATASAMVCQL